MLIPSQPAHFLAPVGVGNNFGEVVALPGGGYVGVWTQLVNPLLPVGGATDTDSQAIFGRQFNADGSAAGAVYQINVTTDGFQSDPDVTVLNNGNLVVAWTDGPGLDGEVDARAIVVRPDGTPVSQEILLGTDQTDDQRLPVVAPVSDGGFIVVWEDDSFGFNADNYWNGQRFDASGTAVGPQFRTVFGAIGGEDANLLPLGNDLFTFVGPELTSGSGETFDLNLFTFDIPGTTPTLEISVPSNSYQGADALGFREDAATVLRDGVVATVESRGTGSIFDKLRFEVDFWEARGFNNLPNNTFPDPDQTGRPDPQYGLVKTQTVEILPVDAGFRPAQNQLPAAAAAATADGDLLLVWAQNTGGTSAAPEISLFAQVIASDGALLSERMDVATGLVGTELAPPFVTVGADGRAFVGWSVDSGRNGAGTIDLMGTVFTLDLPDRSASTPGNDYIVGTNETDVFPGSGGADTIMGRDGADIFFQDDDTGTAGALVYGLRNDVWNGGAGNDHFVISTLGGSNEVPIRTLTYGAGSDTLDYSGLSHGISSTQNLVRPDQSSFSPQKVIGSRFSDVLLFDVPLAGQVLAPNQDLDATQIMLHAESGDDTIYFSPRFAVGTDIYFTLPQVDYVIDGGAGFDRLDLTEGAARSRTSSEFTLVRDGDHYVMTSLVDNGAGGVVADVEGAVILRGIEEVVFSDRSVALDPTPSVPSGALGQALGGGGAVTETGTAGDDLMLGSDNADTLSGAAGDDTLIGGAGGDRLDGQVGSDLVDGGPGNDFLYGDGIKVAYTPDASAQVYRLYQATLGREPDHGGHQDWTQKLHENTIEASAAAAGFVNSAEFQSIYGALDNVQFVELLYQNVLGRASDPGGLQGWLTALATGSTRADVVVGFSDSTEFITATREAATRFALAHTDSVWSDDVYRLYQATLNRAPDLGGFMDWVARLGSGTPFLNAITGFTQSAEFQTAYGALSSKDFVYLLYQNVLGRPADAGGLSDWLDRMAGGMSRAEVVKGFAQSGEFVAATAAPLEAWMRGHGTDDVLNGGAETNSLIGGLMSDTFVFDQADAGQHWVYDLEPWDSLDFRGFGYTDAADALDHMRQSGTTVSFSDQGVTVFLVDTALGMIDGDMIL